MDTLKYLWYLNFSQDISCIAWCHLFKLKKHVGKNVWLIGNNATWQLS